MQPANDVTIVLMDHAGRLAGIEATQKSISENQRAILIALEKHTEADEKIQQAIHDKLTEIVSLKHKGLGAFWLAAGVIGLVLATFGSNIAEWIMTWFKH